MKNIFFALLCTISLFTFHTTTFPAQQENIAQLQKQYFQIREARDTTFSPETAQAWSDLQANPDCPALQDAFKLYEHRLNACNDAMLKLRAQAFPQEVIFIPKD